MSPHRKWVRWIVEARQTLRLGFPIMAGMVGHMLLGLADSIMVGRVGVIPLAGAALVNTVSHVPMVAGIGLLSAVQILASQAFGARKREETSETLRHGIVIALLAGLSTGLIMTVLGPHLTILGQPDEVVQGCQRYLLYFSWSIVPLLVAHAAKQFCEAVNDPWPPMFILLGSVLLNIFLNWVFIFGNLGAPAMGLDGAGVATLMARIVMMLASVAYLIRSKRVSRWRPGRWCVPLSLRRFVDQLRLGGPMAMQHLVEVGAFALGGLMMGWIGADALAAHQVALTCAATTFMFAMGIGMGVGIRVGRAWGAGLRSRVSRIVSGGMVMGVGSMGVFAVVFMLFGREIASWFVFNEAVIGLAAKLLLVAAFFQLFDGTQVIMISALRGMSDVRIPLYIVVLAHWCIALPLAYALAFPVGLGALGNWVGLATGLAVAALGLTARFLMQVRQR